MPPTTPKCPCGVARRMDANGGAQGSEHEGKAGDEWKVVIGTYGERVSRKGCPAPCCA